MVFFPHGVLVSVPAGRLRERVVRALHRRPPGRPLLEPTAVLCDVSGAPPAEMTGGVELPIIRLWTTGRRVGENPFGDPRLRHVLGAAPRFSVDELQGTLAHLRSGAGIPLRSLVSGEPRRFTIGHADHIEPVRGAVRESLTRAGVRERVVDELLGLTEEMVVNARYDAPVHAGKPAFRLMSRRLPVPVVEPIEVEVVVGAERLAVVVRDRFGSLTADQILQNLDRCYRQGPNQVDGKWGGAGLGLYMLLAGSSRLVFNICAGVGTEVILVRDHVLRQRDFQRTAPTLNICEIDPGARR